MGLLDDLEKEAERRREEDARQAGEREHREKTWSESLLPAMQRLDAYLRKLTENLSYLKKRTRLVFPLHGYGDVVTQAEPNYVIHSTPAKQSYDINIEFIAHVQSDECPAVMADNISRVKSLQALLQQHGLGGMGEARKNPNGDVVAARFQARGKVPMSVTIHADSETGVARFAFNNMEGFGHSTRSFHAEQLDDKLFDALGRFIAREELRFAQEAVPDEVRRQLQSKIQRDHLRRDWEQKLSRQLADDEAKVIASLDPSNRPGWLLGRIRLLSVKLFGR